MVRDSRLAYQYAHSLPRRAGSLGLATAGVTNQRDTSTRKLAGHTSIPLKNGRFINDNYRTVTRLIDARPQTVMHGDAHPGNVYFRDGAAGLLDWQAVRREHPGRELAYTLVTSMTSVDRQASERDLLDEYRRAAADGGLDLDRAELWRRCRQGALYAYVSALITAGMGGMQNEDIAMEGLKRALDDLAALDDLDTVPLLKRSWRRGHAVWLP